MTWGSVLRYDIIFMTVYITVNSVGEIFEPFYNQLGNSSKINQHINTHTYTHHTDLTRTHTTYTHHTDLTRTHTTDGEHSPV
jgi:hypothetical protein